MKAITILIAVLALLACPVLAQECGSAYSIEQVITIPSPTETANFLNHGNRTLVKCGTSGSLYPIPQDAKTWLFVGGFAWGEFEKSRTLYIRNFYDLAESRDLTFPADGLHNGISSTAFSHETGMVYVLFTHPNTITAVNPVTLEWHDISHAPTCSNGQIIVHRGSVYLATQTNPSELYRYSINGQDELLGHAVFEPSGAHMVIAWGDWIYTTNGSYEQPITLTAHDWQTCEAQFQTDFADLGQFVGTHTATIVPGPTDSEAYLLLGPEGATQGQHENQSLIRVNLANWQDRTLIKPFGIDFTRPIWGVKHDGRYVWVTYGCDFGGVYAAFDPKTWLVKKWIQLPPELSFPNGGASVIGNELVGTRFAFEEPGKPSTMFRLRF